MSASLGGGEPMKISWWRVLLAGIVAEIAYAVFLQYVLRDLSEAFSFVGMIAVLVFFEIAGFWVGRTTPERPVLNGALVGVVGIAFYFVLGAVAVMSGVVPESGQEGAAMTGIVLVLFIFNHAFKLLGGIAGAYVGGVVMMKRPAV